MPRHGYIALTTILTIVSGCRSTTGPGAGVTHPEGIVAASLTLSGRPHGISIAPGGEFCVSQIDGSSIACGTVSATSVAFGPIVAVGSSPAHVALDPAGRVAYTANQFGNDATIVNLPAAQVVGSVPLGNGGFNVVASATRAYVTTANGQLFVIDAGTRQSIANLAVGSAANGLALDTIAGTLYVSSRDGGTVTAVNTATNQATRTYTVGAGAQRVALSPDRATLYVANERVGVQILDLASGSVAAIPGVSTGAVGLALSPDGARLYVTNPPGGLVQIVDPTARQVVTTLTGLGTPRNAAFGANGATALVTNEAGSVIVIR